MSSAKRERLKRHASMDDESGAVTSKNGMPNESCTNNYGVKSYLNHFYDLTGSFKDPDLYEEEQGIMLLTSPRHRSSKFRCCSRKTWNVFALLGVGSLVAGIALIVAGMILSYHHHQPSPSSSFSQAAQHSDELAADACRIAGVMLFCAGGLVLATSLLVPSFTWCHTADSSCEDDDLHTSYSTIDEQAPADINRCSKTMMKAGSNQPPPPIKAPSCLPTATTTKLTGIQPSRVAAETRLVGDNNFIPY